MKALRSILFVLWGCMFCIALSTFYALYTNLTREDGIHIAQVGLTLSIAITMCLICYRSFQTLYTEKIAERLAEDPKMSGFKFFLLILGIPAIIVPGIFLYQSLPEKRLRSETFKAIGRESAITFEWNPEPGFVIAFCAGIVLVSFAILYPVYVKRLARITKPLNNQL